jgi:hypothetical protein
MSTESDAAAAALAAAVLGPKRVKGDAGEVEQFSMDELIAAEKYLKSLDAGSKARRGLRFTKLLPPGCE